MKKATLTLLFCCAQSFAHPHSWIEMNTYIQGNEQEITSLYMVWEFDAMTTAYMLDGEDRSDPTMLKRLANSIAENMLGHHYFTYFYQDENPIKYRKAIDPDLTLKRGKATLRFDLPLAKPVPLNSDNLKLLIFDPTYYVDMSWNSATAIHLSDNMACNIRLEKPNPTPEQMAYAMALPIDADPDEALGQLFTETVYIDCHYNE
ncbi:DUF1007 family protein [Vibrio tubiashii]|uniref:DUF1007 family protein n=1 Tax=Vibrio tubiashii TaxID=29498 RepID=UPI001EFD55F0|nr:DUF1007 family protein [Vibrio tubiashii]MCG9579468.1 DUF1007 family protein [Vibrio tubiashii]